LPSASRLFPALGGRKSWSLFVCGKRRLLRFVGPLFALFAVALACWSVCAASLSRALYTYAVSHPETPQRRAAAGHNCFALSPFKPLAIANAFAHHAS